MASFQFNPSVIDALRRDEQMAALLRARAELAAELARSTAPVGGDEDPHPGQFRDSIRAEAATGELGLVGRVLTDDPAGNIIEFGSEKTPAHATLRRAVEATVGPVIGGH